MSEGHCIRLFDDEELVRENIEPEIERASLDSIVLQLLRVDLDPMSFDFLTHPGEEILRRSIANLLGLACVSRISSRLCITKKGELLSDLPFHPSLSEFVYCSRQFQLLPLSSNIAAVLSAPGSIFFRGGGSKEKKAESKLRIAEDAAQFDSDLLHQCAVFAAWEQVGSAVRGQCFTCQRKCSAQRGCKSCRVKHAMASGLNNKVLECVASTVAEVRKTFARYDKMVGPAMVEVPPGTDVHAPEYQLRQLAVCLEHSFAEQIGVLLVPSHPAEGARMLGTDVRVRVSDASTLLQKSREATPEFHAFFALEVTQLPNGTSRNAIGAHTALREGEHPWVDSLTDALTPRVCCCCRSGMYVAEKLHPLMKPLDQLDDAHQHALIRPLHSWPNLALEFAKQARRFVQDQQELMKEDSSSSSNSAHWSKYAVITYDVSLCRVVVHGPEEHRRAIIASVGGKIDEHRDMLLQYEMEEKLSGGSGSVKFIAGMEVLKLDVIGTSQRLRLRNLRVANKAECAEYLSRTLRLDVNDSKTVKWWSVDQAQSSD